MKIFNGTPHNVSIIEESSAPFNSKMRKNISNGNPGEELETNFGRIF